MQRTLRPWQVALSLRNTGTVFRYQALTGVEPPLVYTVPLLN